MTSYIPIPNPITPTWLTSVLHQSPLLPHGEVTSVEQHSLPAFNSRTSRLSLHYSPDVPLDTPTHLILKQNTENAWGAEAGAEEVSFYSFITSLPTSPPVLVPCYAAAHDKTSGNSYLLLLDLSDTHQPPLTRAQQIGLIESVPSAASINSVVDALAQLHAYWWNHPALHTTTFEIGHWSRNEQNFELYLQRRTTSWESLIAHEQSWLPADIQHLYAHVLTFLPHHWQRYLKPRFQTLTNLTLVHGDAYFCNFLCPKEPAYGPTYLLDWQTAEFHIGAHDLVNLCATFWTSEQRHASQREATILHHYHTTLQAHGVTSYSWDNLLTDYQCALIYWLLMPVQDRFGGAPKDYWWPKMQCLLSAFREWHCEALL